jgi:hypothetical protein
MARGPSALELKWIREKYSKMSDRELSLVKSESIIPEAREILTSELAKRQVIPQVSAAPTVETANEQQALKGLANLDQFNPPLGTSRISGILLVLDLFIGTDVDSWTVKSICIVIGSLFIAQGKKCHDYDQRIKQLERDATAKAIRDKLDVNVFDDKKKVV